MTSPLRAVIYARISKDTDGRSEAPERQIDACRARARTEGWQVVGEVVDRDLSAFDRKTVRPGYERVVELAKDGACDIVLVWKFDRLLRRAAEMERWIDIAEAGGAQLASCSDPADTTSATGRMTLRMVAGFAQLSSEETSLRIRAQRAEAARRGVATGHGRRPYGLTQGHREIVPEEAEIIREIAARIIAGDSLRSIQRDLIDRGVPTITGAPWSKTTVKQAVMKPSITGLRAHHGVIVAEGLFPTVLDRDVWTQVVAILTDPRRQTERTHAHDLLLRGMCRCGKCGGVLHMRIFSGTPTYSCRSKPVGCNGVSIRASTADDHVASMVRVLLEDTRPEASIPAAANDPTEIVLLEARLGEIATEFALGRISRSAFDTARSAVTQRIHEIRSTSARTLRPVMPVRWGLLDHAGRVAAIRTVVDHVVVGTTGRSKWVRPADRLTVLWRS
jgi:site-specific DNA recombinase